MALHLNLIHPADSTRPDGWLGIDTHFGPIAHGSSNPLREYLAAQEIQRRALSAQASVIVFPETVVPYWTAATDEFWRETLAELSQSGKTVLVGARIPRGPLDAARFYDFSPELAALANAPFLPVGRRYQSTLVPPYLNSIVVRGKETAAFQQRVPVPIAMWNPFAKASVPLNLIGPGVLSVGGKRAAILICYEQLIVWPVLTSMLQNPDVLVGVANDYWAAATTIPKFQASAVRAWARLFGIPHVLAINR